MAAALDLADTGDPLAWVEAYKWLFVARDGVCQEALYFRAGVGESHGWESADASLRDRMKLAARSYLDRHEPNAAAWVATLGPRPDIAGYGGLVLLAMSGDLDVRPLEPRVWRAWAPVICSYPGVSGSVDGVHEALRRAAYRYAPAHYLDALCALALHQDRAVGSIHALDRLPKPEAWDDVVRDRVSRMAREDALKSGSLAVLLGALIRSGSADAVHLAMSLAPVPPPVDHARRSHAAAMASTLLCHASNETWGHVWKLFEVDAEFGKEVILRLAGEAGYLVNRKAFAQSLAEDRAARLFVWVERHFPRANDPDQDDWHPVSRRESAGELRDGLLRGLVVRGTDEALQAIAMIQEQCPHLPFIKWQLLEARKALREKSWAPMTPREVLALLDRPDRRVVSNGGQLFDVLCRCLEALQDRLRLDSVYARTYWEQQRDSKKYSPVTEGRFRDLVAAFLSDMLIGHQVIVNREVEIISNPAGHLGQRTDIIVQAALPASAQAAQPLTVVVECKGCWNSQLRESLKSQLVDRYLGQTVHKHGLYLVGWFDAESLAAEGRRQRRRLKMDETMEGLRSEAASLCRGGLDVRVLGLESALPMKP